MADGSAPVIGLTGVVETKVSFNDNHTMVGFCGTSDKTLSELEAQFDITILRTGNQLSIQAPQERSADITARIHKLVARAEQGEVIEIGMADELTMPDIPAIISRKKHVAPRTATQAQYVRALHENEMNFGVGPAGTGKTYLSVAVGVSLYLQGMVEKLILSRPAVEAGEKLGYLPGDMKDKVDPYMQPLYDALNDLLPGKQVAKMIEEKTIEIAPLAFMRGRTFSGAYVVLDEAQNASVMQMKMFLTRLGRGSRMAITGDPGQVDLPRGVESGLSHALSILSDTRGIAVTRFQSADVVRHPLVARIIDAYEGEGRE